eukprot:2001263-Prymnesium_polylepis.2
MPAATVCPPAASSWARSCTATGSSPRLEGPLPSPAAAGVAICGWVVSFTPAASLAAPAASADATIRSRCGVSPAASRDAPLAAGAVATLRWTGLLGAMDVTRSRRTLSRTFCHSSSSAGSAFNTSSSCESTGRERV